MKLAIMQPYLFPYLGYFQLIRSVDQFVVLDDVQFIKRGWINRNRILIDGKAHLFTFSMKKAPFELLINEREFSGQFERESKKFLSTLTMCYAKAPFFKPVFAVVEEVLAYKNRNVSQFIINSLAVLCDHIGIKTKFHVSSDMPNDASLTAIDNLIDISVRLKADQYINPIGGQELYDKEPFAQKGITLSFLKTNPITYPQFNNTFIDGLSIIDVLMFNDRQAIESLLNQYELV